VKAVPFVEDPHSSTDDVNISHPMPNCISYSQSPRTKTTQLLPNPLSNTNPGSTGWKVLALYSYKANAFLSPPSAQTVEGASIDITCV